MVWFWCFLGGYFMEGLKFLGKPAPKLVLDSIGDDGTKERCEHLEGAIKEAAYLMESRWSVFEEKKYLEWAAQNHKEQDLSKTLFEYMAFLLRRTIGDKDV